MKKKKGLSIIFDNAMKLTSDSVNTPIKQGDVVIGVITFVNEKSIYGLIWDKSISFNEDDCSFEIVDIGKDKSNITYRIK